MPESGSPPRRRAPSSLKTKIVFVVCFAALLSAAVVSGIALDSTHRFLRARIDQTYPELLERHAERLVAWLDDGKAELLGLAESQELERALGAPEEDRRRGAQWLAQSLDSSRFFEALVLLDARGDTLLQAGKIDSLPTGSLPPEGTGPRPRLWAADASWTGSPLVVSAPLRGSGPWVGATLHGIFRRSALEGLLSANGLGPAGGLCLVDSDGRLRAPPCRRSANSPAGAALPIPLAALASGQVQAYRSAAGDRVVGAARPLGVLDWHLLVEEPFTEAYAPMLALLGRVLVADAAILLLLALLAHRAATALLRPVEALSSAARRIAAGQLDVEIRPFDSNDEIGLLTLTLREMTRKLLADQSAIEQANAQLKVQNDELQRANEVLEQLSITDGLTKLHNHRFFQDHLTREIKRVGRSHEPLSILVIDIDDFKRLNDRQGHKAGDELLLGLARILSESIRENDFLARYGGEEFVVLAPATDLDGCVALGEKIRTAVAESSFILGDSKQITKVTISVGASLYKGNRRAFFQGADQALYRAKAAGKNCVMADEGGP